MIKYLREMQSIMRNEREWDLFDDDRKTIAKIGRGKKPVKFSFPLADAINNDKLYQTMVIVVEWAYDRSTKESTFIVETSHPLWSYKCRKEFSYIEWSHMAYLDVHSIGPEVPEGQLNPALFLPSIDQCHTTSALILLQALTTQRRYDENAQNYLSYHFLRANSIIERNRKALSSDAKKLKG
jgi:hypothetical protein